MTSIHSRFLALVLLTACADDGLLEANPPELFDVSQAPALIQQAAKAVVRVQHRAGSTGTGSFLSADGLLLANEHVLGGHACAREGCVISISFGHERGTLSLPAREFYAVPQHVDVGLDMAVLQVYADEAKTQRINTPNFLTIEPRTASELLGEHVTAIGHPMGRLKKWSAGHVISADGDWFDTDIFSLPGGSGSPMVNDRGMLVGLLHRGADGLDNLTLTGSQVTAVASASANVQAALSAPLPPSVISLAQPISVTSLLERSGAFLAASTWSANVDGSVVPIVSVMARECDASLARDDYTSFEQLLMSMSPCFTALDFIECRTDVFESAKTSPKQCPTSERATWLLRLQTLSQKQEDFNGSLDLSSISYSTEALAETQAAAMENARANLLSRLALTRPKLDFTIGSYLAAYGIDAYEGQDTRDFFLGYASVPFYERYAWQISTSLLWLYAEDKVSRKDTLGIIKELYRDPAVSIGAKLRIEEVLYNADEL